MERLSKKLLNPSHEPSAERAVDVQVPVANRFPHQAGQASCGKPCVELRFRFLRSANFLCSSGIPSMYPCDNGPNGIIDRQHLLNEIFKFTVIRVVGHYPHPDSGKPGVLMIVPSRTGSSGRLMPASAIRSFISSQGLLMSSSASTIIPTTCGLGGLNWLRRSFSNSESPPISITEKDRLGGEFDFTCSLPSSPSTEKDECLLQICKTTCSSFLPSTSNTPSAGCSCSCGLEETIEATSSQCHA